MKWCESDSNPNYISWLKVRGEAAEEVVDMREVRG